MKKNLLDLIDKKLTEATEKEKVSQRRPKPPTRAESNRDNGSERTGKAVVPSADDKSIPALSREFADQGRETEKAERFDRGAKSDRGGHSLCQIL